MFYVDRNDWSFQPLYNESFSLNDSFYVQQNEFYVCGYDSIPVSGNYAKLTGTPDININGTLFKSQVYSSNGPWRLGWNDQVIKNIGGADFPYPFYDFESCSDMPDYSTGYNFMGLRCYYDEVRGYVKFSGSTACDVAFYTYGNEEYSGLLNLKVFPNPSSDYVEIIGLNISDYAKAKIEIVDLQGRKFHAPISENKIDVTSLKTGIYLINVAYKNMRQQIKIVKI